MDKNQKIIIWLRQDLRLEDNPALFHAIEAGLDPILIYIYNPDDSNTWKIGSAQIWWLEKSLISLDQELKKLGSSLIFLTGDYDLELFKIIKKTQALGVYYNKIYEPFWLNLDYKLNQNLNKNQLITKQFNASLLLEPDEILNQQNQPFKVFTPFYHKYLNQISLLDNFSIYSKPKALKLTDDFKNIGEKIKLHNFAWSDKFNKYWDPGEVAASHNLAKFIRNKMAAYLPDRDYPELEATSNLSAHLHFGEISPRQIWLKLGNLAGAAGFKRQLIWREFASYLLYHYPEFPAENFKENFDQIKWHKNSKQKNFQLWQLGQTGYPIVDAGMRELWETGDMHNRVRMITASFLVKDLWIDWRLGEKWFWDTLLDADLANNSVNWQWVAGTGVDPMPYFRIFNPELQSKKFDPAGNYLKKWLPVLKNLDPKYIHAPWKAKPEILRNAGINLGENYPYPIVDHETARKFALREFKRVSKE